MIQITIPGGEVFDEHDNTFHQVREATLNLEHSLVSISKWEAKWKKPFLSRATKENHKTTEEILDYIRCMTITQNVDPYLYYKIPTKEVIRIREYIEDEMTATTFSTINSEETKKRNSQIVTSELIYYWMIAYNIPFECQKWHINRLLTLIRICGIKNADPKKMPKGEANRMRAKLNAERRARLNSKG